MADSLGHLGINVSTATSETHTVFVIPPAGICRPLLQLLTGSRRPSSRPPGRRGQLHSRPCPHSRSHRHSHYRCRRRTDRPHPTMSEYRQPRQRTCRCSCRPAIHSRLYFCRCSWSRMAEQAPPVSWQSGSAASMRPSQSLSMPSVQVASPKGPSGTGLQAAATARVEDLFARGQCRSRGNHQVLHLPIPWPRCPHAAGCDSA